jgi:hemerythrin
MTEKLVEWSDALSIGIPEIDNQHRVLIDLLNQLHAAIREQRGRAECGEILERLIEYTRVHFATEESVMSIFRYPELEAHRQEHQQLIDEVSDLKARYDREQVNVSMELIHFLKVWLQKHIVDSDKKAGQFVVQASAVQKPGWWQRFFGELFHRPQTS